MATIDTPVVALSRKQAEKKIRELLKDYDNDPWIELSLIYRPNPIVRERLKYGRDHKKIRQRKKQDLKKSLGSLLEICRQIH